MDRSTRFNENCHENAATVSKSIEKIIEDSQHIGELLLSGKNLTDLPASIIHYDLSDLYHADLSRNCLNELPCFLFNFLSLEHLNCHHNAVKSIPLPISQLKHLVLLNLSCNQLIAYPSYACQLSCLQVLNLSNNKIQSLPEDVGQLKSLMELDLSRNMLTELPDSVGKINSLRSLDVHNNQLTTLNPVLVSLKLVKLDISVNKISQIPLDLHRMVTLDDLNINNNPLVIPPQYVMMKGRQHILAYLALEQSKLERKKVGCNGFVRKMLRRGLSSSTIGLRSISHEGDGQMKKMMSDSGYITTNVTPRILGQTEDYSGDFTKSGKKRCQISSVAVNENRKMVPCLSVDTLFTNKYKKQQVDNTDYMCKNTNIATSHGVKGQTGDQGENTNNDDDDDDDDDDSLVGSPHSQASTETLSFQGSPPVRGSRISLSEVGDVTQENTPDGFQSRSEAGTVISSGNRPNLFDIGFIVSDENSKNNSNKKKYPPPDSPSSLTDKEGEEFEFHKRFSDLTQHRNQEAEKVKKMLNGDEASENKIPTETVFSPRCKKMLESMAMELNENDPVLTIRRNINFVAREKTHSSRLQKVLETLLKTKLSDDIGSSLKDGVLLCQLANLIIPNSVPKIYVPHPEKKHSEAKCRKNVENFLAVCNKIGLDKEHLSLWQKHLEGEIDGRDTFLICNLPSSVSRDQNVLNSTSMRHKSTENNHHLSNEPTNFSSNSFIPLKDQLLATFCILFFVSTCLCLYLFPLPS